uniref:Uncharacterized protein n=1 Tax=Salarias fasciatus TaxID=181472 RepID=A0A672IG16_SALFA
MSWQNDTAAAQRAVASGKRSPAASSWSCGRLHDLDATRHELDRAKKHIELMEEEKKSNQELYEKLRERQASGSEERSVMEAKIRTASQEAARRKERLLQKRKELETIRKENAELTERKRQALHRVQEHSSDRDLMGRVADELNLQDADGLTDYLRGLTLSGASLHRRAAELDGTVDQQEAERERQKCRLKTEIIQKQSQLSKMQKENAQAWEEVRQWEDRLQDIRDTESEKTLRLGQIRVSTHNMYETVAGTMRGEPRLDVDNTESQLDVLGFYALHGSRVANQMTEQHEARDRAGPQL